MTMAGISAFPRQANSTLLLLTPEQRVRALQAAAQLASLSKLSINAEEWTPSSATQLAMRCADACLSEKSLNVWRKENFRSFSWTTNAGSGSVMVAAFPKTSDGLRGISTVADMLGAGGFQVPDRNEIEIFMRSLRRAHEMIASIPKFDEVVGFNTGFIVPFLCKPPSIGSGSALQMPGALLLPAGVPPVVIAECWIHEALHTELHLAEWLEGSPPASCAIDLPTPWRTFKRPAALLLHGAYVFSSLLAFMDAMRDAYAQVPPQWQLSATKGARIAIHNIHDVMIFRKRQILEALQILSQAGVFSEYGKKTLAVTHQELSAL